MLVRYGASFEVLPESFRLAAGVPEGPRGLRDRKSHKTRTGRGGADGSDRSGGMKLSVMRRGNRLAYPVLHFEPCDQGLDQLLAAGIELLSDRDRCGNHGDPAMDDGW